jgi:hypothetical protein
LRRWIAAFPQELTAPLEVALMFLPAIPAYLFYLWKIYPALKHQN